MSQSYKEKLGSLSGIDNGFGKMSRKEQKMKIQDLILCEINYKLECHLSDGFRKYQQCITSIFLMPAFWIIRFSMLSISAVVSACTIWIILRKKLQQRLIMAYTLMIAISQQVMAVIALLFGAFSLGLNLEQYVDPVSLTIENNLPLLVLTQFEGAIFKSAELISFSLTTELTFLLYCALNRKDITYLERILRLCSIFIPIGLMTLMACFSWMGLCVTGQDYDYYYYNSVCNNKNLNIPYYIIWALPCVVLAIITFVYIFKIINIKRKRGFKSTLRDELKLVLIIYYIPSCSFFIYLIDLSLTTFQLTSSTSVILIIINNSIFLMPLVNLITTLVYKKRYEQCLDGNEISSLLSSDQSTDSRLRLNSL